MKEKMPEVEKTSPAKKDTAEQVKERLSETDPKLLSQLIRRILEDEQK